MDTRRRFVRETVTLSRMGCYWHEKHQPMSTEVWIPSLLARSSVQEQDTRLPPGYFAPSNIVKDAF